MMNDEVVNFDDMTEQFPHALNDVRQNGYPVRHIF